MKANSKKVESKSETVIEKKLNKIPLDKISKESEFCKRKPKKITPKEFLIGFFLMAFSSENNSYENWAIKIGTLISDTLSKQALWKRMHQFQIVFLQEVLNRAISNTLREKINGQIYEKLKSFKKVLLEDSTNIKLNDKLSEVYPGNGYWNQKVKKSILKIQVSYEILRDRFERFEITGFRKNDQGYSEKILEIAKKGDLIIRDLGYFVLGVFKRLNTKGIYFISRMKKGINIYSQEDGAAINLVKMLKKRTRLDIKVLMGTKEKLPVRLIAIPVKESIASERKRKAKTNRDKRMNPGKEHLFLLGWELFITNVEEDRLDINDTAEIYFIRWRIEIIFKCWKSYFKITNIPKDANKIRVESYVYCMLIFIVLFQVSFYNNCVNKLSKKSSQKEKREISLMKLMQYISSNINLIFLSYMHKEINTMYLIEKQIKYYCLYDLRKDRTNFCQKFKKLS